MNPRSRRVTIAAAVLGVAVVGVLVALNWGTVRNHVEAWNEVLRRGDLVSGRHGGYDADLARS
jgi:hypothetical protein